MSRGEIKACLENCDKLLKFMFDLDASHSELCSQYRKIVIQYTSRHASSVVSVPNPLQEKLSILEKNKSEMSERFLELMGEHVALESDLDSNITDTDTDTSFVNYLNSKSINLRDRIFNLMTSFIFPSLELALKAVEPNLEKVDSHLFDRNLSVASLRHRAELSIIVKANKNKFQHPEQDVDIHNTVPMRFPNIFLTLLEMPTLDLTHQSLKLLDLLKKFMRDNQGRGIEPIIEACNQLNGLLRRVVPESLNKEYLTEIERLKLSEYFYGFQVVSSSIPAIPAQFNEEPAPCIFMNQVCLALAIVYSWIESLVQNNSFLRADDLDRLKNNINQFLRNYTVEISKLANPDFTQLFASFVVSTLFPFIEGVLVFDSGEDLIKCIRSFRDALISKEEPPSQESAPRATYFTSAHRSVGAFSPPQARRNAAAGPDDRAAEGANPVSFTRN